MVSTPGASGFRRIAGVRRGERHETDPLSLDAAAFVPYHSLMSATATAISDVEAKVLGSLGLIFFGVSRRSPFMTVFGGAFGQAFRYLIIPRH